jgi:hypothetical protein
MLASVIPVAAPAILMMVLLIREHPPSLYICSVLYTRREAGKR